MNTEQQIDAALKRLKSEMMSNITKEGIYTNDNEAHGSIDKESNKLIKSIDEKGALSNESLEYSYKAAAAILKLNIYSNDLV